MKPGLRLRDIMQTKVLSLTPDMEVNRAMRLLLERNFSGAPVLDDDGNLLGVLSQKDCVKAALNAHYHQLWSGRVQDYMSAEVETFEPSMDLVEVAHRFLNSSYRRFPVLEHGKLVGQVSRREVLLALSEQWS